MERPAGLGRSLEDVLNALAPADPDAASPGRVLFESDDVEQQLDELVGELRELNDRVEHLVALVPDAPPDAVNKVKQKRKKGKNKRKNAQAGKHGDAKKHKNKKKSDKHKSGGKAAA